MPVIRETDLPGIGRKYQVDCRGGDRLVIIIHDDGKRELYHFKYEDLDESISMVTLDDAEARQIAGIIGGMTYNPKALEKVEVALDDLLIEWLKVEPEWKAIGKTIGDLQVRKRTGATVIAVVEKDHTKRLSPGPEHTIREGATVVVAGERAHVKAFRNLLITGSG